MGTGGVLSYFYYALCIVGGNGPTDVYPDPMQADGSAVKPTRKTLKRRSPEMSCNVKHPRLYSLIILISKS